MNYPLAWDSYSNYGLDDRGSGVQFSAGTFLISIVPRQALGHTQLPIQ